MNGDLIALISSIAFKILLSWYSYCKTNASISLFFNSYVLSKYDERLSNILSFTSCWQNGHLGLDLLKYVKPSLTQSLLLSIVIKSETLTSFFPRIRSLQTSLLKISSIPLKDGIVIDTCDVNSVEKTIFAFSINSAIEQTSDVLFSYSANTLALNFSLLFLNPSKAFENTLSCFTFCFQHESLKDFSWSSIFLITPNSLSPPSINFSFAIIDSISLFFSSLRDISFSSSSLRSLPRVNTPLILSWLKFLSTKSLLYT